MLKIIIFCGAYENTMQGIFQQFCDADRRERNQDMIQQSMLYHQLLGSS